MVEGPNFAEKILTIEDVTPFPHSSILYYNCLTPRLERPILNSPYEYPVRHWELDPEVPKYA
jgi:hypothetical protein